MLLTHVDLIVKLLNYNTFERTVDVAVSCSCSCSCLSRGGKGELGAVDSKTHRGLSLVGKDGRIVDDYSRSSKIVGGGGVILSLSILFSLQTITTTSTGG